MHVKKVLVTAAAVWLTASAAAAQQTVSFASSANREAWRGETAGSQAAFSLDRGDVNAADGRRDLIVGAPGWSSSTGRVYIVFAGPVRGGEQPLANADVIITGGGTGNQFGWATAAGYVTAQELAVPTPTRDLVVGAPGAGGSSGAVYLFLRGFTNGQRLTVANAAMTITGAPAGARLGTSLATGDLDGDGYREIIIGAPGEGAVYVVRGAATPPATVNLSAPSAAFFKIQGAATDGVGSVVAAGDFLGHFVAGTNITYDLAIGAPNESGNTGAVYLIAGRAPTNPFPAVLNLPADATARYGGIDAGDLAGRTLQVANLDKDRFSDLLVGAPWGDGPGNARAQAGEIYVIWGAAAATSKSLAQADLTIYGAAAGHQEGAALVFGDVTRDGTSDFTSLAPGATAAGDLHLFNGRTRAAWGTSIDLLFVAPDRRLIGDPSGGVIQTAVMFDLTGEGFDDIAAGYPADDEGLVQISYSTGISITESPASRTINPNSLTTFSAAASGSPAPDVQWQVSTDGTNWTNIPGATSTQYALVARTTDSGKRFRAVFSNSVTSFNTASALLTVRSVAQPARRADLDGDGASDIVVWRPSSGTWFSLNSGTGYASGVARQWGNNALGDKALSGDIDGDGIVDLIVWRPGDGTWYWLTSGTNYAYASVGVKQWGNSSQGDIPMLADMDGDTKADLVIWRASTGTWFWLTSSSGYSYASARGIQWGNPSLGDKPMIADFDGDKKGDLAVWRTSTGTWFWLSSTSDYSYSFARGIQWGNSSLSDVPLTGDLDGDGKTELIVWRPGSGMWFWLKSTADYGTVGAIQWGNGGAGDIPAIGDFDGDGRGDLAIWRQPSGTWFWLKSSSNYNTGAAGVKQFGASSDLPMVK